jgi:peptidase M28-like protein
MFRRLLLSIFRITATVVAVFALLWWFGVRMPGKNVSTAASLSADEVKLREELRADVEMLGGQIGERNLNRYTQLIAATEFIENSFRATGLQSRRDTYAVNNRDCHNIEAEIRGSSREIVLVGAHYDSVFGAPGANDNGSGVAAVLALARRLSARSTMKTLRFVAFVNEEPPYFQTPQMGSFVYASRCKTNGDQIKAMISLETIGCFSDEPHSQKYPAPGLGIFYPTIGNFIGFVGNVRSRSLLRSALSTFRGQEKLPSEGAALPAFIPGVSWSDQWAFWKQGYSAIMVTDTAPFRYRHYHQPSDTPDKLDYDRFALVVSGMEKVIVDLVGANR